MELEIIGHNVEILPNVRSYVEKKLGKINRHLPSVKSVKIELMELKSRATKYHFRAQVTLEADGLILRAEEQAENLLIAVDKVVPALDRQIERFKDKTHKKNNSGVSIKDKVAENPVTEKGDAPQIVRTKRFQVSVMTDEEAVHQMELLGHDFFLFNNAATKELNLLYRRKDGNYSIIEPELT
jgi:putative sigma-54 modulation protein